MNTNYDEVATAIVLVGLVIVAIFWVLTEVEMRAIKKDIRRRKEADHA